MLSVTSCGDIQVKPIVDGCIVFSIIRPSESDVDAITEGLLDQLLLHNQNYEDNCKEE
jgi:hypothetical protein